MFKVSNYSERLVCQLNNTNTIHTRTYVYHCIVLMWQIFYQVEISCRVLTKAQCMTYLALPSKHECLQGQLIYLRLNAVRFMYITLLMTLRLQLAKITRKNITTDTD